MQRHLLACLLSATTLTAVAQGTVNFSNLSTALTSPPDRLIRFAETSISVNAGAPATTNFYPGLVAQLFYGTSTASQSSLFAVSTAPGTLRSSTSANAGTWFGNGTRTLNGFNPGDTVSLQVRVWDITVGTDLLQIINTPAYAGHWWGFSSIFSYTIPTNPTPAPSEFNMSNFTGFGLYTMPEPSVVVLLGFGAAALMFFRSRR
jgi:hypothetical protein